MITVAVYLASTIFVALCVIYGLWFVWLTLNLIFNINREQKIIKYMKSIGFERYLQSISGFDAAIYTYGYRRLDPYEAISEPELFRMKLRDVKKKFKART